MRTIQNLFMALVPIAMRALPATFIFAITVFFAHGQTNTPSPFVPPVNVPGTAARLLGVKGVTVDSAGYVFFASGDYSNYTVLRWDAGTGLLTSVVGNGTPGYSGDNGPATSAQLDGVTDVAVDRAGNLYIADANNSVVRKVSNGIITTVAGGGPYPGCDQCGATGAILTAIAGVATDSVGNLYIVSNEGISKVSNGVIARYARDALSAAGAFALVEPPAVDSAGNFYAADTLNHRIVKVANGLVTIVAGNGKPGFSGDNGPATAAQLVFPAGVTVDAAGNLYIADTGNQRIRKVSNGVITTVAGFGPASPGLGDNGPATSAGLNYPSGVGVDSTGNLYIEDTVNNRIRKVSNGVITTIAGGGSTSVLLARSAGVFAATGSMTTARRGHTATLLDTGEVLIAGGQSLPSAGPTTAELYDPATATFTATGSPIGTFTGLSATLLPDGRVFLVGVPDSANFNNPAIAQLYDPSTGAFSSAGTLVNINAPLSATLLNNGKVLITGLPPGFSHTVAELYDPSDGTFTATGDMVSLHVFLIATLLPNGNVLVAEGTCYGFGSELYDPVTGAFSPITGTMPCGFGETQTLLQNGTVLIQIGSSDTQFSGPLPAAVYDPVAGTFSAASSIAEASQVATLLPDATVLITGGDPCTTIDDACYEHAVADATLFDSSTRTFGSAGVMTAPRDLHQATLLPDGTVLITGGGFETFPNLEVTALASAEIYTPPVLVPSPALFSISGDARGQGAIWHAATGQIASSQNPAVAGDVLATYTTSLFEGGVIPPQVAVGGELAEILYFGDAPGYPGYFQVNFRVPNGVAAGSAVPVRLNYLSRPSNAVTIGVQQ